MDMKKKLASLICMGLIILLLQPSSSFLDVGGDFGLSWLEEHSTKPVVEEVHDNLWKWGGAPKGFKIYNGTVYPPGQAPLWYYPSYASSSTPIIINSSAAGGQPPEYASLDPWLTAQLTGRPVALYSL
ncbi:MAG: hypothetical protein ACOX84_02440 [Methanothrix sp.]